MALPLFHFPQPAFVAGPVAHQLAPYYPSVPGPAPGFDPQERHAVRKQFQFLDANKDGAIVEQEFVSPFSYLIGKEAARGLFFAFDVDHDGHITQQEFEECLTLLCYGSPREKAAMTFKVFDKDQNGSINTAEFDKMLAFYATEQSLSPQDVARIRGDFGPARSVTCAEFVNFILAHPRLQGVDNSIREPEMDSESAKAPVMIGSPGWDIAITLLRGIDMSLNAGPPSSNDRHFNVEDVWITEFQPQAFAKLRALFGYNDRRHHAPQLHVSRL
jgi:Ca2+-binding EF-hand superfamily protein|uniref:EF-hand domain-containing protein n=1 Tax=Eutreptiella gymnastica TaxID=73025 RepID=A0A7S4CU01_9EUGL